jgi:hypothetical protein
MQILSSSSSFPFVHRTLTFYRHFIILWLLPKCRPVRVPTRIPTAQRPQSFISTDLDMAGRALSAAGGTTCTLFASRSAASPSGPRFFSFSFSALRDASFWACRRASLSFRSFSLRRAFDSNSCQSPSSVASLHLY